MYDNSCLDAGKSCSAKCIISHTAWFCANTHTGTKMQLQSNHFTSVPLNATQCVILWLLHQNYKVGHQCILLYRSMSSIAFCRATSGFSVPVDTNKLRTATARSLASIVGLPTCRFSCILLSCIHCATNFKWPSLQCADVDMQIARHLKRLCIQAPLMAAHWQEGVHRIASGCLLLKECTAKYDA